MAILEVGRNKQFAHIGDAIDFADDNDEIQIFDGLYVENIICEKKLILKGIPQTPEDYRTYPVIYNRTEISSCIFAECKISNIIFTADLNLDLKDLRLLMAPELNGKQELYFLNKYWRYSDDETTLKEKYLLVIDSSCQLENCIFFGALRSAATIQLQNGNLKVDFKKCGFFFNAMCGIFAECHNKNQKVIIDQCVLRFNMTALAVCEKGDLSVNKSKLQNNTEQALAMSDSAKALLYESTVSNNQCGIEMAKLAQLRAVDCDFYKNREATINCLGKSEANLYSCKIDNNKKEKSLWNRKK